ncbi:MAG: hypothetical protein DMD33_00180 [Gemmatimonadetes bacterium]|nr:MAG: hypothetical protein DMD33_00180 [Gemmatimonadota bacterium]
MKPARLTLLTFVLLPLTGSAADLRVAYTVQEKPFKTTAVTGTNLTFQLYSDSTCTTTSGAPIVVPVDNLDLIERLKRGIPKGGTKVPATDRLVEVLTGVSLGSALYLKVTGTGVTPEGPACQFQEPSTGGGGGFTCLSEVGTDLLVTGCNLNVRSGSGSTGGAVNGKGNLIIGYNEGSGTRTGSHNVIVGPNHSWTSFAGIVAGSQNTISAAFASVTGGYRNTASGYGSSVSGGQGNEASGYFSSVSGGRRSVASGYAASVSGGYENQATGNSASVSGGGLNYATDSYTVVSGGKNNYAQYRGASISGGAFNHAQDLHASVSGGIGNYATSRYASVSGGNRNRASGRYSSVSGGYMNTASAKATSVTGGSNNSATANYASVGGGNAVTNANASTWHAGRDAGFPTATEY